MPENWKIQQWAQDWKRSVFIPMPKNAQTTIQLHSSHMLVMLKILQARLQQYMNHELPDVQAGFRKGRGIRDQIVNIHWSIEKARKFQQDIYFCFIHQGFPGGSEGRASACSVGDLGSIPGSGRSPGEGNGTHSSILAWRIPWVEEPGGLQSMGLQRVRHN